jgi:hypothetical protein
MFHNQSSEVVFSVIFVLFDLTQFEFLHFVSDFVPHTPVKDNEGENGEGCVDEKLQDRTHVQGEIDR